VGTTISGWMKGPAGGYRARESFFLLPWPAAVAEGMLQAQQGRRFRLPGGIAVGTATLHALADGLLLRFAHRPIDQLHPVSRPIHGPRGQHVPLLVGSGNAPPEAALAPLLGASDQAGPKSVAFDIPAEQQDVAFGPCKRLGRAGCRD